MDTPLAAELACYQAPIGDPPADGLFAEAAQARDVGNRQQGLNEVAAHDLRGACHSQCPRHRRILGIFRLTRASALGGIEVGGDVLIGVAHGGADLQEARPLTHPSPPAKGLDAEAKQFGGLVFIAEWREETWGHRSLDSAA